MTARRRWAGTVLVLISIGVARSFVLAGTKPASALPYYDSRDFTPRWAPVDHRVAPFQLVDQRSQPLTERDLDGKIHVATFLFTRCPSVCPVLVQRLKPVQDAARRQKNVLMISYSVTPLTDTSSVLADFGRARGIDPETWRLATGELSEIKHVLRDSYFADDPRPNGGDPESRLLHTEKVLLVDGRRRLRGIYNGTNAFEIERLIQDIATLQAETGRPAGD